MVAFCTERLAAALKVSFSAHIIRLLQLDSSRLTMLCECLLSFSPQRPLRKPKNLCKRFDKAH
jgi:hypothetical protein